MKTKVLIAYGIIWMLVLLLIGMLLSGIVIALVSAFSMSLGQGFVALGVVGFIAAIVWAITVLDKSLVKDD